MPRLYAESNRIADDVAMARTFVIVLLLALAGCAGIAPPQVAASPCSINEASYECQVERYFNVSVP
jgi:hypothetical protein